MNTINIYVGNLSFDVTEEQLRQKFVPFGGVTSVTIMNDKYIGSGQPIGYAYVEMTSRSEAEAAIAGLRDTVLGDQAINVIEALPLTYNENTELFRKRKGHQLKRQRRERTH
jgi:RNA recognition motif-containing protein